MAHAGLVSAGTGEAEVQRGTPCTHKKAHATEKHSPSFPFFSLWEKKISVSSQEEIRITCWTDNRLFCVCLLLIVCACTGDYFGDLCAFMHVSAPPAVPLI